MNTSQRQHSANNGASRRGVDLIRVTRSICRIGEFGHSDLIDMYKHVLHYE
jgi:hypothetical protein